MVDLPGSPADIADAERNGMTVTEWLALSNDARAWRREHPDQREHPKPASGTGTGIGPSHPAEPYDPGAPWAGARASVATPPGHAAEAAAPSGAVPAATPGLSPAGQGAQVILTGDAQAAARGGLHGTVVENTAARDAAIDAGHVAKGTTQAAADFATGVDPTAPGPKEIEGAKADTADRREGRDGARADTAAADKADADRKSAAEKA